MKTYKTWEVIKLLTENKQLKFNLTNGPHIAISMSDNNYITLEGIDGSKISTGGNISINDIWELEQQPVNFIEAINSKGMIKAEDWGKYKTIKYVLEYLSDGFLKPSLDCINGKWFIKELRSEEYEGEK